MSGGKGDATAPWKGSFWLVSSTGGLFAVLLSVAGAMFAGPAIAADITVGTAPGQFSVSPIGAATYQIPIQLPPGVNGLKPSLALLYNSQAGNGILGMGWSLTGLSVITRCPRTLDQDNTIHIPDGTSVDRFCLDGQRLILTSGSYGADGSVYHTEIESFQQVTANGSAGGGPKSFTVVDRSGLTRQYSTTPFVCTGNSRCPNGALLEWLISKITDRYGNFISFRYNNGTFNGGNFPGAVSVSEIDYGSAANTVGKVLFIYDNGNPGKLRADSYSQYVGGTGYRLTANAVLLTGIQVENGSGTVLRSYHLSYNTLPDNPAPPATLASVQESAGDGEAFNPTTFSYTGRTADFSGGDYLGNSSAIQGPDLQILDLDGDGLPDYVYAAGGTVYVIFGSNLEARVATSIPLSTDGQAGIGLQNAVATDLNGDGRQELLVPYYSHPGVSPNTPTWSLLKWNGQAGGSANVELDSVPTTAGGSLLACAADDGCTPDAVAVDMNGDGEPGILFADDHTHQLYYYANVNGALSNTAVPTRISFTDVNAHSPRLTPVNYDGQGTPEVYVAGTGVVKWDRSAGAFKLIVGNFNDANDTVVFVNDGGLTGAVVLTSGNDWYYCANNGQGFSFLQPGSSGTGACNQFSQPANLALSQAQAIDFYGNGQQEVIVPDTQDGTWYLLDGNGDHNPLDTQEVPYEGSSTQFVDVNGDGRVDMLFTSNGHTEAYFNIGSPSLLSSIRDGLGHSTYVAYVPLTGATHSAFVAGYASPAVTAANRPCIRAYVGPMYVVSKFAVDTGLRNSDGAEQIFTYYKYGGPALDQCGRGFLGFARVEAINYNSGLYTDVTYNQTFPFAGMVATSSRYYDKQDLAPAGPSPGSGGVKVTCTTLKDKETDCELVSAPVPVASFVTGSKVLQTTTNGYPSPSQVMKPYSGVYYPHATSSETRLYDLDSGAQYETTTTVSTYQTVGASTPIGVDIMPTEVQVTTSATGGTATTATVDTTTNYGQESTCPGHATQVSVVDSYESAVAPAKTETFQYNGACSLIYDVKTIVGMPGGDSMTLATQYGYGLLGNPIYHMVSGSGVSSARTTRMTYDPSGRFPVSITNALGQTESLTYNDWGEKLTDTDANGDTITYSYDGFGRKTKQSGPESGLFTIWAYGTCQANCVAGANIAYVVKQSGSDGSQVSTQYDDLGRAWRSVRLGFNGEPIVQDTEYDLLGRVSRASIPYKSTIPYKSGNSECLDTKSYDILNRITSETQPYDAAPTSCGSTRTVGYFYAGLTTIKTISAPGTDVKQESTTTALNALGKPSVVSDAAAGTTAYRYDPWGNVIQVTPPDGATVSMSYDSAGDKWGMQDPDMGVWHYKYDALGELLAQTDAKGQTVTNTYDALGRLVARAEPEGTSVWKYDIAYGASIGRLAYKQGPGGVWEGFAYDAYGKPTDKITVINDQNYWVTTTYDDQGRVHQVVYPNLSGINLTTAPPVPAGLTAAADPDDSAQIDLEWTAGKAGEIYYLYRTLSGAAAPELSDQVYSGPKARYHDSGITNNGSYEWWLKACVGGSCSAYATVMLAVHSRPTVPGAPSVPSSDTHETSIKLAWSGSTPGSGATTPVTYKVLESYTPLIATAPGPFFQTATSNVASATVELSNDGTYVFAIQACTGDLCSGMSDPSAAYKTYLRPGVPTSINAPSLAAPPSSPATYSVSWSKPDFSGGAINYVLQEKAGTGAYTEAYTGGDLSHPESKTQDGEYIYRVQACDANTADVCSGFTDAVSVKVTLPQAGGLPVLPLPTDPGLPTPPASDQHVFAWPISWAAATPPAGSADKVTYELLQAFDGGDYSAVTGTQSADNGTVTLYSAIATLSDGYYQDGTYSYELRACTTDAAGNNRGCTNYVSGDSYTTVIAPGKPSSLNVPYRSNTDGSFTVSYGAPAAKTGGKPTDYRVELGDRSCESPRDCTTYWVDASCTSTSLSCTFKAGQVEPGYYSTRVVAFNGSVTGRYLTKGGIIVGNSSSAARPAPTASFDSGSSGTTGRSDNAGTARDDAKACYTADCGGPAAGTPANIARAGDAAPAQDPVVSAGPTKRETVNSYAPRASSGSSPAGLSSTVEGAGSEPAAARTRGAVRFGGDPVRVAQAFSTSSFGKRGRGRARRKASSGHTGMYALDFRTEQGSAVRKSVRKQPAWHYAPAINPKLSEYPPLRRDPRVLAHFASLGGQLPGRPVLASSSEPTGGTALMVGYVYNSRGYLEAVERLDVAGDPVRTLWRATDETARGQVDKACFDGAKLTETDQDPCEDQALEISKTYDPASGLLDGTTASASVAGDTVSASYTWDGYNNLSSRTLSESVAEGQSAPAMLTESFDYDALNRMGQVTTSNGTGSHSESMRYNAVGGFQYKGNYTGYKYGISGHAHAVSSLTTPTGATRNFTYDADGNLLTESGGGVSRAVAWTSYNKPARITGDGATETFLYGPDRSRLQTAITEGSDTVTTTYIDGLFEQVYDSATGNLSYRHYILAGGARVGVETINASAGGNISSDTLSFYVRDEVGSVIASVTENLGGAKQSVALTSYGAWGKARATSGSTAYAPEAAGSFYSPTPSGQQEGFAGHDNLNDTGLVDMEGRVYDPEVGNFLSADPNVQYPFSSQGYDRYSYVNDNPLSLSDPSGYFSLGGFLAGGMFGAEHPVLFGRITQAGAPLLNLVPYCQYWCAATAEMVGGYLSSGGDVKAGIYAAVLTEVSGNFGPALTTPAGAINWTAVGYQIANSVVGATDPQAAAALALVEGDYHEFARGATTAQGLKFAAKYLGEQYVQWKARQEMARVAERNGMNLAEMDALLFGASELGNWIVGTRFTENFQGSGKPGENGFFTRPGGLITDIGLARTIGGIFDATDTLLGMQGLPTASGIDAISSRADISEMTGHSLGAIDVNNLTVWGYVQTSTLDALPFPMIGVGNAIELQIYDPIGGFFLGWLTNPDAHPVHGTCIHEYRCGGFTSGQ